MPCPTPRLLKIEAEFVPGSPSVVRAVLTFDRDIVAPLGAVDITPIGGTSGCSTTVASDKRRVIVTAECTIPLTPLFLNVGLVSVVLNGIASAKGCPMPPASYTIPVPA